MDFSFGQSIEEAKTIQGLWWDGLDAWGATGAGVGVGMEGVRAGLGIVPGPFPHPTPTLPLCAVTGHQRASAVLGAEFGPRGKEGREPRALCELGSPSVPATAERKGSKDALVSQSIKLMKQRTPEIWDSPQERHAERRERHQPKGGLISLERDFAQFSRMSLKHRHSSVVGRTTPRPGHIAVQAPGFCLNFDLSLGRVGFDSICWISVSLFPMWPH